MRTPSRRPEQVGETIRQVVADALSREVRDPRVGFVTVTGVRVTNELSHARVLVSVHGDEAAKASAMQGLESAAGFLRSRVARALTTRTVPELHFELDRGHEHAARIHELLTELKRDAPEGGNAPETHDASEGGAREGPEAPERRESSD